MIEPALFIDAIGLKMFFMLLEVQTLMLLNHFINFKKVIYFFQPTDLIFMMPSAATLMAMLVLSAFIINFF